MSIVDAEEMEYPKTGNDSHRAAILKKIELHRKVFPQHEVVGWYRVQNHDDKNSMNLDGNDAADASMPTEEDLRMNQTEMARYCGGGGEEGGSGDDEDGAESPLFVLMNAHRADDSGSDKKPSAANNASEEMEGDEELPLAVYETLDAPENAAGGGAVFVNVDFDLETYEPERIAVEKVFKTRPSTAAAPVAASADDAPALGAKDDGGNRKAGKKSKKDDSGASGKQKSSSGKPTYSRGPTELDGQLDSLQSSVRAMNVRMNVLLEYLEKVKRGDVRADGPTLRSIDGLVQQLPLVLAALEEGHASSSSLGGGGGRKPLVELKHERDNTMLLTYLAAVAKTQESVYTLTNKYNALSTSTVGSRR